MQSEARKSFAGSEPMSSTPLLQQGWGRPECPREAVMAVVDRGVLSTDPSLDPVLPSTTITPECSPVPSSSQQTTEGNCEGLSAHLSHRCLLLNTSSAILTDSTPSTP